MCYTACIHVPHTVTSVLHKWRPANVRLNTALHSGAALWWPSLHPINCKCTWLTIAYHRPSCSLSRCVVVRTFYIWYAFHMIPRACFKLLAGHFRPLTTCHMSICVYALTFSLCSFSIIFPFLSFFHPIAPVTSYSVGALTRAQRSWR